MEGRGRKSTAALSVVAPTSLPQRMEPPRELTEGQADLWRKIVSGKPVDWFADDNAPLLAEYVRAVDMGNRLAIEIEATLAGTADHSLKDLLRMRDTEAKRATSIATKLRLTQQSRYTPQAAATADKKAGAKPWQFGQSN